MSDKEKVKERFCSFCGVGSSRLDIVVAAEEACICNFCVSACRDLIGAHRANISGIPPDTDVVIMK